nr:reverse transcriptase domain-containing protein [Tanacetum cinerariifolium]
MKGARKAAQLMKLMTEVYCPSNEIKNMENELWNLTLKDNDVDTIHMANILMDQKVCAIATRDVDHKIKWEYEQEGNHRQQQGKRQEVGKAYVAGIGNKTGYAGTLPLCDNCKFHHHGLCLVKCGNCKKIDH